MALIGKIRENTRLLVIIVSLGLLFFIARELLGLNPLARNRVPIIGSVAGKKITLRAFQAQVDNLQRSFFASYEQTPSEEEISFLKKQVWKQLLHDIIYTQVCKDLSIQVTEEELVDMVQGEHIHPDLQAAFVNPATKEFSKKDLISYLRNLSQLSEAHQVQWHNLENNLSNTRCQAKFNQLMERSVFVTTLEAQHTFTLANTPLDVRYLHIPYHSIVEESVTVTDSMLKNYLHKHAKDYPVEEEKDIRYVTYSVSASEKDRLSFQKEIESLKQDFVNSQEDSLFASIHTESHPNLVYLQCTEKDLPTPLLAKKGALRKGAVIDFWEENGHICKLYKITKLSTENTKKYEVAVIEKSLTPSDETKEVIFKQVDDFVRQVKNVAQFDAHITSTQVNAHPAKVSKHDTQVGNLLYARPLVRWLYNEAKVGSVSPILELGDSYVIAIVVGSTKPGTAPLEKVKEEIKRKVTNEQKEKIINKKLQAMASLPIETIAEQYGSEAKIFTAQQVKFSNNTLPGIGSAPKASSQAFALQPGKRSKIINDLAGIVLIDVMQQHIPALPDSWNEKRLEQTQLEQRKQFYQLAKALEVLACTKDYRHKYY